MPVANPEHLAAMMPKRETIEEERKYRKEQLAAAFRVFGKFGFSAELKDYQNMLLGSGISDPPTLVKEHSSRLLH